MAVPGLMGAGHNVLTAVLSASSTTTDLHAALGSPSGAVRYHVFVGSGVVLGSTSTSTPALDATGLHVDSVGTWWVDGDIIGCGGDGGEGDGVYPTPDFGGGGGGGGAGSTPGGGGSGHANGSNGSNGGTWPTTTGGAAGSNSDNAANTNATGATPTAGGDGLQLNHAVTIHLSGTIGGGGGGGDGGYVIGLVPTAPASGGGVGVDSTQPAGYAIRYSGSGAASVTGGTVLGTVG